MCVCIEKIWQSLFLSAITMGAAPQLSTSESLEAKGPTITRQPLPHPGMRFASSAEVGLAWRIRGGCLCCGGGFLICGCNRNDDQELYEQQQPRQAEQQAMSLSTVSQPLPVLAPVQPLPVPAPVLLSSMVPQSNRRPAQTLPTQPRPDLPGVPIRAAGGRAHSMSASPHPKSLM